MKGYWYLTVVYYCPACGSEDRFIERQYTPKPTDQNQLSEWIERWDNCDAL